MFEVYKELFDPEKVGGRIIMDIYYPRNFYFGFIGVFFGVLMTKLKGTEMSMFELSIISSVGLVSTLLMPFLGRLKLKTLLDLSIWIEIYMLGLIFLILNDYISNLMFIYLSAFQTFMITLVWCNITTKTKVFIQQKCLSKTADPREKGNLVLGSIGAGIGILICSTFTLVTDDLKAFMILYGFVTIGLIVVLLITNIKIIEYCYNDNKYPVINK